jgi:hypothetical protein
MRSVLLRAAFLAFVSAACAPAGSVGQQTDDPTWTAAFQVGSGELSATGRNPYFVLEPGYELTLEGGAERLVITVLNETKIVDGVQTRVVEERHTERGELVEVARNYFVISTKTNDVYYFGEDVDIYKGGAVPSHEGAWLSGVTGAKFGLMMPGKPAVGQKFYQEVAPPAAKDRAEILSVNETVNAPAGAFKDCMRVEETSPYEPGVKSYKVYAPGIGLVEDGKMKLVKYGKP